MRCASCAHENRPQAKFCAGCGATLPRSCAQCGAELPPDARFCDDCGAPVGAAPQASRPTPPAPEPRDAAPGAYTPRHLAEKILTSRSAIEGERKIVTVFFADVAGFTAMSTRLDPEDLHNVMDGCFRGLMDAVHRFEGTVNQFTGDGVMALFGAPIAHEDHAVRAVAAALETQRALRAYAGELQRTRALEFGLRIGLNTGPVVVGKIGDDLRMDYTAQGETVNLAARLQAAGEAGGVLASESTYRLTSRHFTTEELPRITVKGIAQPVRAFRVTGERTRRVRFDAAVERGLTPFVGRESALDFLVNCFARVETSRGQAVSIVGDAGIGKSRLVYEFRRRLANVDCRYLRGGCLPHGEASPFRLVVDLLRSNFAIEEAEPEGQQIEKLERAIAAVDSALTWTLPYVKLLLALPSPELDAQGLDQAQRKIRTLEALKALLFGAAVKRPLVLLVEDLQWIDKS
jgi:class 3 adenylate cyclase